MEQLNRQIYEKKEGNLTIGLFVKPTGKQYFFSAKVPFKSNPLSSLGQMTSSPGQTSLQTGLAGTDSMKIMNGYILAGANILFTPFFSRRRGDGYDKGAGD